MDTNKQPRRAGARWREGAPSYIVDCFDSGDRFYDRYTVFVLPAEEGSVMYLGVGDDGGTCFGEMKLYEAASYRYCSGHKRVKWLDLPEKVRAGVKFRMEEC